MRILVSVKWFIPGMMRRTRSNHRSLLRLEGSPKGRYSN